MQAAQAYAGLFGRKKMKKNKKKSLKFIQNKFQNKCRYTRARMILAFRGIVISGFGSRFFSKDFVQQTFQKVILGFLGDYNQVLLVQFCVFIFIRSFVNDIHFFRSIMKSIFFTRREFRYDDQLTLYSRRIFFRQYIRTQYKMLTDLKKSLKETEPNSFIFNLPNMKKNYLEGQKMRRLLSTSYLKDYASYKNVIGKITNRIMVLFGIEASHLKARFNKLFYVTFSLMVNKRIRVDCRKRWKKVAYRARFVRRRFIRQRRTLKNIASRLMSSITFYDK